MLRDALAAAKTGAQSALLIGEIESLIPASTRVLLTRGTAFYREKPRAFARRLDLE